MKIGILTLPLTSNYGGIIQACALSNALNKLGHEVILIKITRRTLVREKLFKFILKNKWVINLLPFIGGSLKAKLSSIMELVKIEQFIDLNFKKTKDFSLYGSWESFKEYKFDAVVVGSDQVWRPKYCLNTPVYFCSFLENEKVKKVAYAASFGVNHWEYKEETTNTCRELARKFDAVSVREKSGVELCKNNLKINAIHVLDPTFLPNENFYNNLISKQNCGKCKSDLKFAFVYILDKGDEIVKEVENIIMGQSNKFIDQIDYFNLDSNFGLRRLRYKPSPAEWLSRIKKSSIIFTDSFHGTVFSIIFKKPFWVLNNSSRGSSRIESILEELNLKGRMINSICEVNNSELFELIDYEAVDRLLNKRRQDSLYFLKKSLSI